MPRVRKLLDNVGRRLFPAVALTVFLLALYFLHRELAAVSWDAVLAQVTGTPLERLLAALLLTALSYSLLTGYDWLALRYVARDIPYPTVALTAFMAYAVGHNVGVSALSGGSIRYRVYSQLGLSSLEIAKVIAFCTTTFAIGASLLMGVAFWVMPPKSLGMLPLDPFWIHGVGVVLMVFPLAYVGGAVLRLRPLAFGNWSIAVPGPRLAGAQVVLASLDLACAAGVLYVLLAPVLPVGFFEFAGIYLIAMAAGVISSVPGGVGVVETVLLLALPTVDRSALLGGIVLFRVIYYLLPFGLALTLLSARELRQARTHIARIGGIAGDWLGRVAPATVGALVFLGGVVLLLSGAAPSVDTRLSVVGRFLPLPVLEISHMLGSILGVLLLVVAQGLYRRLHRAYALALAALLVGAVVSLVKGLDVEEAVMLSIVALVLWTARSEFYRGGLLIDQKLGPRWLLCIAMAGGVAIWLMFASYRHVEYSNELWWQFSLNAQAPRALRAALVAAVALAVFALRKLLRPSVPEPEAIDAGVEERLRNVIAQSRDAMANVALLGDKRILFNETGDAFIMYQVSGRSWIALGDPVGPRACWETLIWRYRELCDRHDGWPAFYQVTGDGLPLYVDAGLSLSKLGESARVPLAGFSLSGSNRAPLRHSCNRARREGATVEIVARQQVAAILPQLRVVSDDWLRRRSAHEKGFSLGAFDEAYLTRFDCAVVRVGERIVAFTNLWQATAARVLSVDLMRYHAEAPAGTMDFLFVEVMLWGQQQGFEWFDLGMAPLSGLETHPLAPLWHKVGHLIYQHGDAFYDFDGLRSYKEKFDPVWEPRYLAAPGGLKAPRVLIDASVLIAGGVREVFGR
ncbi:MAG: bifunctional lysylphosphatidylglycerol flippase/synthetase MprF [Pseudomonadales bacterium]